MYSQLHVYKTERFKSHLNWENVERRMKKNFFNFSPA
jgi:hypothetical protein